MQGEPMLHFQPLDEFGFHHALASVGGVALVLFSGPDCGACRQVERLLPEAAEGLADALYAVDVQQSMGLARAYEVFHLPALFLFIGGQFHRPVHGEATPAGLRAGIRAALSAPAQEEP